MAEARLREEESLRLQEELETARILMEENQRALEEARNQPPQIITVTVPAVAAAAHVYDDADAPPNYNTYENDSYESAPPTSALMTFSVASVDDDVEDRTSEHESSEQSTSSLLLYFNV